MRQANEAKGTLGAGVALLFLGVSLASAVPTAEATTLRWEPKADDWLHFRYTPQGTGVAPHTSLITTPSARVSIVGCAVYNPAVTADLNGDGKRDFVVSDQCGFVRAYGAGTGVLLWSVDLSYPASMPTVGDVDNDGKPEVVVVANDGRLRTLSGASGGPLWPPVTTSFDARTAPVLADFDLDGRLEILVGNTAYNGESGSVAWSSPAFATLGVSTVVGHLGGSAALDIVALGNDCRLRAIDGRAGEAFWTTQLACPSYSYWRPAPTLVDMNGDGIHDVFVHTSGSTTLVNGASGLVMWTRSLPASTDASPVVGDLEGDGKLDLIALVNANGNVGSKLFVLDAATGAERWTYTVTHDSAFYSLFSTPVIVDVNNDGLREIVFGSNDGRLYAVSNPDKKTIGSVLWYYAIGSNIRSSPIVSDLDGDGGGEIFFSADNGALRVLGSAPVPNPTPPGGGGGPGGGNETVAPTTTHALAGSVGLGGYFLSGVTVTLSAADNAGGSGIASTTYRVDGGAVQTYVGPFLVQGDGAHTITYASTDKVGNAETQRSTTFAIDATPPTTRDDAPATGWLRASPVIVRLTPSDATSGPDVTVFTVDGQDVQVGTLATISGDGDHQLSYRTRDRAGNLEPLRTARIGIDRAPPETRAETTGALGKGGWFTSVVTVTLSATDTASGVARTRYSVDGGPLATYVSSFALDADGDHVVRYHTEDVAGNVEATKELHVKVDATAPATGRTVEGLAGENGWFRSAVNVTLSCADATSGCDATRLRVDEDAWAPYDAPVRVESDGAHRLLYASADVAGNVEETLDATLKIDATAPRNRVVAPEPGYVYANDLRIAKSPSGDTVLLGDKLIEAESGDDASGVARVEFLVNGEVQLVDHEAPYAWTLKASEHALLLRDPLEVRAIDRAGNVASRVLAVTTLPATLDGLLATVADRSPPDGALVVVGPDGDGDRSPASVDVWNPLARAYETVAMDPDDANASDPAPRYVEVTIPTNATLGADGDADGVPSGVAVETTIVRVDRDDPANVTQRPGETVVVPVDPDDADPSVPLLETASVDVPSSVELVDADGDTVPESVLVRTTRVTASRHDPANATMEPGDDVLVELPVALPDGATADVPTSAELVDADADGVPEAVLVRTTRVAVARSDPTSPQIGPGDDVIVPIPEAPAPPPPPAIPEPPTLPPPPEIPEAPAPPGLPPVEPPLAPPEAPTPPELPPLAPPELPGLPGLPA